MKVLSMIQPWASLLVLGETKYETRSWKTKYRGPLAIHASQKTDKQVCRHELVIAKLAKHGYSAEMLPNGVIMATCQLTNCYQVIENSGTSAILDEGQVVSGVDYLFGDYDTGYYAWEIKDRQILSAFIPAKGKLGLWEYISEGSE
ncbi:ASCH domain-containing protein [Paenibacillus sp. sgz302251]|uniref:ASCH domain-containing protein n=1 Tax=Paenibacillus sp. sgz302251 TaxID=3414493 RepID=UPI003C7BC232